VTPQPAYSVRAAVWPDDAERLREIRTVVFVHEQKVPAAIEWDGTDGECTHVIAEDPSGTPVGTGRLTPDGKIGRMAVLAERRGEGIGRAMVRLLVEQARELDFAEVKLGAQTHAIGFYQDLGFEAFGDEFEEAGMPHQMMRQILA